MNSIVDSIKRWWRIDAVGVLVLALVTTLCYVGFIFPAIENREAHDELQPQVAQRSGQVQGIRSSITILQAELNQALSELEDLPLRLETSSKINSRLAQLTEMASEEGLVVHQMKPDTVRPGQRYDIVPITLSGEGSYSRLVRFMQSIHADFADISVVGFDLDSSSPSTLEAQFDIGLAWYTLPAMSLVEN